MSDLLKFKMSKITKRVNFDMLGFIKKEKRILEFLTWSEK